MIELVSIIQDFIPKGRRNRPGYAMTPSWITIHDTANPGNGAGAKAHANYVKGDAAAAIPASWHFSVDDKVIYQHLPLNENGWHAGDGNGPGNRRTIGIEICENRDGDRNKAEANAAWLCAKLIQEVASLTAFSEEVLKQHYDWSGKNCPHVIRARKGGWDGFKLMVSAYLSPAPAVPFRVIVGSFLTWDAAEAQAASLKKSGFETIFAGFSHQGFVYIRIICGDFADAKSADQRVLELKNKGFDAFKTQIWEEAPLPAKPVEPEPVEPEPVEPEPVEPEPVEPEPVEPEPEPDPKPVGTPIMGEMTATLRQAREWARLRNANQRFIEVAELYWMYGAQIGIRPEVLYAQSAKETAFGHYGGAVHPDQNNWAGIKVKNPVADRREDHESFASPEDGVRAHFNHICAYIGLNPIGEPHDRYSVIKSMPWAGKVRTVEELSGKWAPAADYGQSIINSYLNPLIATRVEGSGPIIEPPAAISPEQRLIAFTFDDFNPSDYERAYPVLKSMGVRGTSYAHTGPIEPEGWGRAREMAADGWDIQCHTVTHPDLTKLSDAQIRAELDGVNAAFVNNGLPAPQHHAYPSGHYDQRVIDIVKQYRKTGRSTRADTYDGINRDALSWYDLHPIGSDVQNDDEYAYWCDRVNQAYSNNRIVITIHHGVCAADEPNPTRIMTRENYLRRMVEYALQKGFRVVTISELYQLLTGEIEPIEPEPEIPEPEIPEPVEPEPVEPEPEIPEEDEKEVEEEVVTGERKPFWKQKKWWAGVVGVLIPLLNHVFKIGMDTQTVTLIVLSVVGYIVGEAWTDAAH